MSHNQDAAAFASREAVDRLAKRRSRRVRSPGLRQPDHDHPFRGAVRFGTVRVFRDVMAPQGLEWPTIKSEKWPICPSNATRSLHAIPPTAGKKMQ